MIYVYNIYIYIYIIYVYIYIYIYMYIYRCPVGVTSLYRVLNYRAINKWVGFQIKKNNFFGT